ncbi:DinB family protein [Hymenobacter weizhouensis]|uniref:DinB family protein n=1 Tax=Hymenobacter sp. YIM 151500-1 TaxID=2987689 RepID=UPI002225C220|nr:DinB family protein [Hymenobacter sp. YIM 151500-1]UYZ61754.1 DinB family protein [Hymenobacter sp. YIM 151500-1]
MQTTAAPPSVPALLSELDREMQLTRRVLERLPADAFDWQPHSKSYSLGQLASHLVDILAWVQPTFEYPEYNAATDGPESEEPATTPAELLTRLERNYATARAALAGATPADFAQVWTFRHGEQVLLQQPRAEVVRESFLNHFIHHRAQLTVYLRLLDVPVPNVYGPTADEPQWLEDAAA